MINKEQPIASRWETAKRRTVGGKQEERKDITFKMITMRLSEQEDVTILTFIGGPNGNEMFNLATIDLSGTGDLRICEGCPNRFPACYVHTPEVRKFVERYKAVKEIS